MKNASTIFALALCFFSVNTYADNILTDDICGYVTNEITFPIKGNEVFSAEGACLRGKNITKLLAGDGEITSASFNEEGNISFYTVGKDGDGVQFNDTEIMGVIVGMNGVPFTKPLLSSGKLNWDDPKKNLFNMKVNYYDKKNSTLYFTTDAWATSAAIHALKLTNNHSLMVKKEQYFTDGDIQLVTDKGLTIRKIEHDDQGAYYPAYLYGRDGKKICQLDTRQQLWALFAPCLAKGEELKVRE